MRVTSLDVAADAIRYHDRLANDWERRYQKASFRARLVALFECLGGRDLGGTQWLDAGCGTGTMSRWLAERGSSVLGVDASREMIDTATALTTPTADHYQLEFQYVRTIAHLPFASDSADGILCSSVLEYVPDPDVCLAEFFRVLRPGGTLLASVPNADSLIRRAQVGCNRLGHLLGKNWVPYLDYSKHQYSPPQFEAMLARQGFCLERLLAFGGPLPRFVQRMPAWGSLLMFSAKKIFNRS